MSTMEETRELVADAASEDLALENRRLLDELEQAYKYMETLHQQCSRETSIAYQELQEKFDALEQLYEELSSRENRLIHMEKLSSIGQFITEIIHELNNPLTVILGTVELVQLMDAATLIRKDIDTISKQASLMVTYLTRLRNMAYKEKEEFLEFDINQNLQETLDTLAIITPKKVKIFEELTSEKLMVKGDPYQISQIYLNLAKNAIDVLKKPGGRIVFSTRRVDVKWIRNSGEAARHFCQDTSKWEDLLNTNNAYALLEVTDDGEGIPDKVIGQIFGSFFTTKPRGKGTGLGLSISSDIAMRHRGNLMVKSTIGKGTTFQLLLPLSQ